MKLIILSTLTFIIATTASAQLVPVPKRDVRTNRQLKPTKNATVKFYDAATITRQLDSLLNVMMDKYVIMPNTATTWTQIRAEATNIIFQYFRSGQLLGTKPEEAFFVKMGMEIMTAADITNHQMILQTGIAPTKPAEFIIITVVKKNKGGSQ